MMMTRSNSSSFLGAENWQVQIRFDHEVLLKHHAPIVYGVAAVPHHETGSGTKVALLHAHSHVLQRRKRNLMLLKCTIGGVLLADASPPFWVAPPEVQQDSDGLLCTESALDALPPQRYRSDAKEEEECRRGVPAVLKMRQPAAAFFQSEGMRMMQMIENDAVAALLPPVFAFVRFELNGKRWDGMCTGHCDWCVNMLIYPGGLLLLRAPPSYHHIIIIIPPPQVRRRAASRFWRRRTARTAHSIIIIWSPSRSRTTGHTAACRCATPSGGRFRPR